MKEKNRTNKGITLITLIITIIVLLIVGGVSIATLIGENGILTRANDTKVAMGRAEAKEKVQIEVLGSYDNQGIIDIEKLNNNLKNILELKYNGVEISENNKIAKLPANVTIDEYEVTIQENGKVTIREEELASTVLKVDYENRTSSYVKYPDKNGNDILCQVLYDANSTYGLQIVAVNSVDTVTLGTTDSTLPSNMASESDFEKAKWSYNNFIKTLNDKAETYRNPKYTEEGKARCIGSVPNNPNAEASDYFTSEYDYMSNYNDIFKNTDTNYVEDGNQLHRLGAASITGEDSIYWFASRFIPSNADRTAFGAKGFNSSSYEIYGSVWMMVNSDGTIKVSSGSRGFRPVFGLSSNVKIKSGEGSSNNPYIIK